MVTRLLDFFPAPRPDGLDPTRFEEQQRTKFRAYVEVVSQFDEIDVRKAIEDFRDNRVRNFNPAWAPTPPQVATHIREVRDKRIDSGRWDRQLKKNAEMLLPAPEKTPEARERVARMMEEFTARHRPGPKVETPEQAQEWLHNRQRSLVAAGIEKSDTDYQVGRNGDPRAVSGDLRVTPQLRELLKREGLHRG